MTTRMFLVAAFLLPLVCSAQLVRSNSTSVAGWAACSVQSRPFEANATFIDHLSSGPVSVTTAAYFDGQSHASRGLIDTRGLPLALDFTPTTDPASFPGWNWVYNYYAVGFPDYIRGPSVLSDFFKAGAGVAFLLSEDVSGFSIDVTFEPLISSSAEPGAYRVFAFGDDGALLGSISSTHTSSNYLDPSTWENLSFITSDFSNSIRGVTVIREHGDGVFIDSSTIRLASSSDFAAVPESSAFLPAALTVLGFLVFRRRRKP